MTDMTEARPVAEYGVDWVGLARTRDDGSARSILDVLWAMGSEASDLWPEKRKARRILLRVLKLREEASR